MRRVQILSAMGTAAAFGLEVFLQASGSANQRATVVLLGLGAACFSAFIWTIFFGEGGMPHRDQWLEEAILFAVVGRWLRSGEKVLTEETQMVAAVTIAAKVRDLAVDGRLLVWGKPTLENPHEPIPGTFWLDNQIDFQTFGKDDPQAVRTVPATPGASTATYSALMVNRAQIEKLNRSGLLRVVS